MEADYEEKNPVQSTTHGLVKGTLLKSIYDDQFYSFDGIPYAQPPLGELRFREPQDIQPWNGILDCSQPRHKCLQYNRHNQKVEGSEDCLYLNIAVKKLRSDKPLPVMVYIHGGRFLSGSASRFAWSPEYLMREDVIYISIGHRTGVFGYLSFADPALNIPGNAALKDIVHALKWIKSNVRNFNGDENNITLFGHSSGSVQVQLLSVSPQTKGLFHKYILMSGSLQEMNRLPNTEYRIAQKLGYEGENIDIDVYRFIKSVDPNLLVSADILTELEKSQITILPTCTPIVEPYETPTAVILAEPRELQRTAWTNDIPVMLGSTSEEFYCRSVENFIKIYKEHPEFYLPRYLLNFYDPKLQKQMGKKLMESICKIDFNDLSDTNFEPIMKVKSLDLIHSQHRFINARLAYSNADNYLYRFNFYSTDFNFIGLRERILNSRDVLHGDELGYIFKLPASFKLKKSDPEYSTIGKMVAIFVEFATRSNPNAPLIQSLVKWKPISKEGPRMCLNINEELQFIQQPEQENLEYFDELYKDAGAELI